MNIGTCSGVNTNLHWEMFGIAPVKWLLQVNSNNIAAQASHNSTHRKLKNSKARLVLLVTNLLPGGAPG